jgi:hypothetical protein
LSANVLTWHDDNTRQGQNTGETILTPANVNASTFGELFSYPVQGQVYAQPLYVSNVTIPGKGVHNVIYVVTENNDVYALDANSNSGVGGGVLWHVSMNPAGGSAAAMPNNFFGNRYGPYHDINPQVGITSTPVIDLATNTMYLDAFTNDITGQNAYSHHIHALDLTTGADKMTPMLVSASVNGNGVGGNGTTVPWVATQQLQRPALTLLNGVLYVCYSGFADTDPYHGWILGFNPSNLQLVSVLNTTPNLDTDANAGEGGIWMTGAGPASDGTNMFLLVANGDFNPSTTVGDWGDSMIKVSPDPSTPANPNVNGYGLKVTDYFTPYNEQALADADADLGSGGGIVLPDQPGAHPHEFLGSGKNGIIYVVDRDSMGHHNAASVGNDNNIIQSVNLGQGNFDSPAYFNGAIYYNGVNGPLKKYTLTSGLLSAAPSATGHDSSNTTITYNGSGQGGTPSISANGAANGIVWNVQFSGSHQVLHAYDASTLLELYNSNQAGTRDQMGVGVKFITPMIADGRVVVGSANAVTVYGLLTPPTTAPNAPSNLNATAMGASTINLTWVDNSDNEGGFKIERSTDGTNFTQIAVATVNATSYSDTNLNPSTTYYYRIRATNVIGDSAYTNPPVSATTSAATGPVNLYHFDAGSGQSAVDSVGNNNGTLQGATLPTWITPGKIGAAALSFSGNGAYNSTTSQSVVKVASDLSPVLGSTSTLDAWFKTTQVGNNTHWQAPAITGVEQSGGGNDINWGTLDATGHMGIYVGDSGGVYSTNAVNDNQWHNIAMTRNAATGQVQVYIDGVLNNSGSFDTGNKTSQFFDIGALYDVQSNGTTFTGANYFNGSLDEVRIYNQVLSANEIAGLSIIPGAPTLTTAQANPGPVVHLAWTTPSAFTQSIEIDRKVGAAGTYAPYVTLGGGITMYDDTNVTRGTQYFYVVKAIDLAGTSPASNELSVTPPVPTVVAKSIFYNGSIYDGNNGSSNLTDTSAVAPDKTPLLPGQTASFANYTTYSKGLNGILIDVANLDNLPRYEDFSFTVGNDNNPAGWTTAPVPTLVNDYPGRGPNGSTQITVIWADNAIQNEWLRVAVLGNAHTGLAADDVFYFGNLIGDANGNGLVTVADIAQTKSDSGLSAGLTSTTDFNRSGQITVADIAVAKAYQGNSLTMLNAPAAAPAPAAAAPLAMTAVASSSSSSSSASPAAKSTAFVLPPTPPAPQAAPKHHHRRAIFSDVQIPLAFRDERQR